MIKTDYENISSMATKSVWEHYATELEEKG